MAVADSVVQEGRTTRSGLDKTGVLDCHLIKIGELTKVESDAFMESVVKLNCPASLGERATATASSVIAFRVMLHYLVRIIFILAGNLLL